MVANCHIATTFYSFWHEHDLGGACNISLPSERCSRFFTHWIRLAVTSVPHGVEGDGYWVAFPFFDHALRQSYGVDGGFGRARKRWAWAGRSRRFLLFPLCFYVSFSSQKRQKRCYVVWVNENENFQKFTLASRSWLL
jgi:hypothetical protein